MSNLSFKTKAHPVYLRNFLGGRYIRELCYNTYVKSPAPGNFVITHHDSTIAEISDWEIYLTNAGWGSLTTRTRLNHILRDNDIPFYVAQRNYAQVLFKRNWDEADEVITPNFRSASFRMNAGVWEVTL